LNPILDRFKIRTHLWRLDFFTVLHVGGLATETQLAPACGHKNFDSLRFATALKLSLKLRAWIKLPKQNRDKNFKLKLKCAQMFFRYEIYHNYHDNIIKRYLS